MKKQNKRNNEVKVVIELEQVRGGAGGAGMRDSEPPLDDPKGIGGGGSSTSSTTTSTTLKAAGK